MLDGFFTWAFFVNRRHMTRDHIEYTVSQTGRYDQHNDAYPRIRWVAVNVLEGEEVARVYESIGCVCIDVRYGKIYNRHNVSPENIASYARPVKNHHKCQSEHIDTVGKDIEEPCRCHDFPL